MTAYSRVAAALEARGARRRGHDWTCPVHDDGEPSLSVRAGKDRALIHCQAGCDAEDVVAALGLEMRDLFDDTGRLDAQTVVATYGYVDEEGALLFEVVRFYPKSFRQRRPNGSGGWEWSLDGVRRVLYRLPAVLEAARAGSTVYVVEGEKDAHAVERAGGVATCPPGGAGKWRPEYAEVLAGTHVVVVADRDEPGQKHARQVAASLEGKAASVRIVAARAGKDAADHLAAGFGLDDLEPVPAAKDAAQDLSSPAPALAEILAEAESFIGRFVVFQSRHQRVAVALWVAHVYAIGAAPAAAYLRVKSAAEESGKTTLLEVLELLLGARAINAVSITPAAVFRFRDKVGPVALLLDEVDNTIRNRQDDGARDLLALVNAGYRRSARAIRTVGRDHDAKAFAAFGPAVVAGVGHLHPTTESRCIPIVLDRKTRGEGERWLRFLVEDEGREIAAQFERWATGDTIEQLRAASPAIVQDLRDRHVEVWWSLWAIAEAAGGEWPGCARDAAAALHGGDDADTMTTGVLLLAHIRAAFDEDGADRLPSATLLHRLVANEEGPWGKWWGAEVAHEDSPRAAAADLARHLRAFNAKPKKIRLGYATPRGYLREDFEHAWVRYLAPVAMGGGTDGTHGTPLASTVPSVPSVPGGYPNEQAEASEIKLDPDEFDSCPTVEELFNLARLLDWQAVTIGRTRIDSSEPAWMSWSGRSTPGRRLEAYGELERLAEREMEAAR